MLSAQQLLKKVLGSQDEGDVLVSAFACLDSAASADVNTLKCTLWAGSSSKTWASDARVAALMMQSVRSCRSDFPHLMPHPPCSQTPQTSSPAAAAVATTTVAAPTANTSSEAPTEVKSDDYTEEMQAKMGTTLTYRHEDGINWNLVTPDLVVGSCLQTPEDADRLAAAGITTVFSLQVSLTLSLFSGQQLHKTTSTTQLACWTVQPGHDMWGNPVRVLRMRVCAPGCGRNAQGGAHWSFDRHCGCVVWLQEDCDMEYFGIEITPIQQRCKELGIKHVRFPVRDFDP